MTWDSKGATAAKRYREACRTVPADVAVDVCDQAIGDAMDLALEIRDHDPRIVWGRLCTWADNDPDRLVAACWAAAAMLPTDQPVNTLLAWTGAAA